MYIIFSKEQHGSLVSVCTSSTLIAAMFHVEKAARNLDKVTNISMWAKHNQGPQEYYSLYASQANEIKGTLFFIYKSNLNIDNYGREIKKTELRKARRTLLCQLYE